MGHNELDLTAVARLDDVELMARLDGLVRRDRALTARLLLHLGEVEARELLVAELAPKPDVPSVVRKLPATRVSARAAPERAVEHATKELSVRPAEPAIPELRPQAPAQVITPLSPSRYKAQFTATQVLQDKLQQLKDHNALLAERDFGRAYIQDKRSRRRPGTVNLALPGLGPEVPEQ